MKLPSIKVVNEYGDIRLVFKWEEFERPELFQEWMFPIVQPIVNNFIGQPSINSITFQIQYYLERKLQELVYYKSLWQDFNGKWDFDYPDKVEPNKLMKKIL